MNNLPVLSAVGVSFGLTTLLGFWLVPYLRRIKYGQTILDIGPKWHKNKQGTPTMGGIMFIIGILAAIGVGFAFLKTGVGGAMFSHSILDTVRIVLGAVMALSFGMVGFIDDYIKVVKKRNLGLSARQKMMMQFIIAIVYLFGLYVAGDVSTVVAAPFLGQWDLGLFYYPLATLGIVYMVNVVNITDGIDGLCASVTFVAAIGFLTLSGILQYEGMGVLSGALAGGSLGFLVWNFHPAKVFMGDTGSMFLGGMVVALAFGLGIPIFLIFMGIVYILEGLSVMLQVAVYRLSGRRKRLFKMSPIHHHYEMNGWSEGKIVVVFSLVQLAGCALAVLAALQL